MPSRLTFTAATMDPALLDLPWDTPLEEWSDDTIAAYPKGISRHVVRFVHMAGTVVAIKETREALARREYEMLRTLQRLEVPCVEPYAVVAGRVDANGDELDPCLVTRHLKFSLPYRALFSRVLKEATATRLVDALALLLVRLHNVGFFWGDVSLSNTLFRRDAGAFAAYLVDAETGELFGNNRLSDGQREHDLEIARVNIAGELMDLQSGGKLDESIDPLETSERILQKYRSLWRELNGTEQFAAGERWRIAQRVNRLNDLGFDIEEMAINADGDGTTVTIQPKVVDAGHHQRRLLRLTGLDVQENQARRLLNDLDAYRASLGPEGAEEERAAHDWVSRVFEPVIASIPKELRGKLEPAEIYHQLLEHRWFISQEQNRNVPLSEAVQSYIEKVLSHRRDEEALLAPTTETIPIITQNPQEDWRANV